MVEVHNRILNTHWRRKFIRVFLFEVGYQQGLQNVHVVEQVLAHKRWVFVQQRSVLRKHRNGSHKMLIFLLRFLFTIPNVTSIGFRIRRLGQIGITSLCDTLIPQLGLTGE